MVTYIHCALHQHKQIITRLFNRVIPPDNVFLKSVSVWYDHIYVLKSPEWRTTYMLYFAVTTPQSHFIPILYSISIKEYFWSVNIVIIRTQLSLIGHGREPWEFLLCTLKYVGVGVGAYIYFHSWGVSTTDVDFEPYE